MITNSDTVQTSTADSTLSVRLLSSLFAPCIKPVFIMELDGTIIDCNAAAELLTGRDKEYWIGTDANSHVHLLPGFEAQAMQVLRDSSAGNPVAPVELELSSPAGNSIHIEVTTFPVELPDRKVVVAILRDISELKSEIASHKNTSQLLSAVLNTIPVRVFWKDKDLKYLGCNAPFAADAGLPTPEDVVGKDDFAMAWKEQADLYREDDLTVITRGIGRHLIEEVQTTPEGRLIQLLTSKVPLRDSDGTIVGVLGTYFDITDRKQAEERNRLLATAVAQSADGIVITDAKGTILYVNPAFEKMTGYSSTEAIGHNPRMLKSGKQDSGFYLSMWETLKNGRTWHGQLYNKQKDGSVYAERMTISPVLDDKGTCKNYVALKRDISHEVEIEQMLVQSQKMEAVGRLAGGVAHDFNNILTVITGYSEMLVKKLVSNTQLQSEAEEIRKAAERASALTRQLLAFSRNHAGENQAVDLEKLLQNMLKMLKRIVGEDVEVDLKADVSGNCLYADPTQIEQIIMNLAVNARDAMPKGGSLQFSTALQVIEKESNFGTFCLPVGTFVVLKVRDTGAGMTPNTLEHLFEPFFTTKEVGKGTGLGLAIVYSVVSRLKGAIDVASAIGEGTTFTIYFPYTPPSTEAAQAAGQLKTDNGLGQRVLLVEDDVQVKEVVSRMLAELQCEVISCDGPMDAVSLCDDRSVEFDFLLTDIRMPQINGCQLAKLIKSVRPQVKLLFMSGHTDQSITDADITELKGSLITKPFTCEQLGEKIRQVMGAPDTQSVHL